MAKARTKGRTGSRPSKPIEIELATFANEAEERNNLMALLKMFYQGAMSSTISLARVKHDDEREEIMLVARTKTAHGTERLLPLATLVHDDDVGNWSYPDGKGAYVKHEVLLT